MLDKPLDFCYTIEQYGKGGALRPVVLSREEYHMATVEIRMLGDFEIRVNGNPVLAQLAQSRKATALVQYLVLQRGERVSHKTITDTPWAGTR